MFLAESTISKRGGSKMDYDYEDYHQGDNIMWIFLILILLLVTGGLGEY